MLSWHMMPPLSSCPLVLLCTYAAGICEVVVFDIISFGGGLCACDIDVASAARIAVFGAGVGWLLLEVVVGGGVGGVVVEDDLLCRRCRSVYVCECAVIVEVPEGSRARTILRHVNFLLSNARAVSVSIEMRGASINMLPLTCLRCCSIIASLISRVLGSLRMCPSQVSRLRRIARFRSQLVVAVLASSVIDLPVKCASSLLFAPFNACIVRFDIVHPSQP